MSENPAFPYLEIAPVGELTLFDSLARLVPEELQSAYYRVLAHTRTLSPDDEMLRILEAMGVLALLTRQTPKEIAAERERFQEMLDLHRQFTHEAKQKMLSCVHELEARISVLPGEIEAGLDPQQIAKLLGESLCQHFLQSGITATVNGLETTNAALTAAQKELFLVLRNLSDSRGGIVAQVEFANNRLTHSLESRAKAIDALLRELRGSLLRIWIPLACTATLLLGLFSGMEIQGCRDSATQLQTTSAPSVTQEDVDTPHQKKADRKGYPEKRARQF